MRKRINIFVNHDGFSITSGDLTHRKYIRISQVENAIITYYGLEHFELERKIALQFYYPNFLIIFPVLSLKGLSSVTGIDAKLLGKVNRNKAHLSFVDMACLLNAISNSGKQMVKRVPA